jgi:hypothetical protein
MASVYDKFEWNRYNCINLFIIPCTHLFDDSFMYKFHNHYFLAYFPYYEKKNNNSLIIFPSLWSLLGNGSINTFARQQKHAVYEIVKRSLCLINKALRHEGVWGADALLLTSAIARGEWSASRPCRFNHGERAPRLVWPQRRSGQRGEEKILNPTGTRTPTIQSVASRHTDYIIPAPTRSVFYEIIWCPR